MAFVTMTYDTGADALYIYLRDKETVLQQIVNRTEENQQGLMVDLDEDGCVRGIEIIHPSAAPWGMTEIIDNYRESINIDLADFLLKLEQRRHLFKF